MYIAQVLFFCILIKLIISPEIQLPQNKKKDQIKILTTKLNFYKIKMINSMWIKY